MSNFHLKIEREHVGDTFGAATLASRESAKTKKDEIQMKEARAPLTSHHSQRRLDTFDGASVAFALL